MSKTIFRHTGETFVEDVGLKKACPICHKPLKEGDKIIFQWHRDCLKVVEETKSSITYSTPQGGRIRIGKPKQHIPGKKGR
jgi:hypothetical protein